MPCEKIRSSEILPELSLPGFGASRLDNLPVGLSKKKSAAGDVFLCDRAGERPMLAKSMGPSRPLAAWGNTRLFAPKLTKASDSLPPPPKTPLARMLYDLTTQLEDFELSADLSLPMEGIGRGEVKTFTQAVMKDRGALVKLGIDFQPFAGPQVLLKPFDQVPIIWPFFVVRVMRVQMNPGNRKLEAKVKYLWFPIEKEVHEDYLEKAQLPPELMKGPGWDLERGLPVYSWQILDLVLKILEKRGAETAQNVGIDQVKPILEKGEIHVTGNFSNRKVRLGGLTLHFAPLPAGERHRLTVNGSLLEPKVKVHGLQAAEWSGPGGFLKLANAGERLEPLEFQVRLDPLGDRPTTYEIPSYRSQRMTLEGHTWKAGSNFRLEMREGIAVKRLRFRSDAEGPLVEVETLRAKRLSFRENGVELQTTPGDEAVFSDVELRVTEGGVHFVSKLSGKATGELKVNSGDKEIGFLKFQALKGTGRLEVKPLPNGDPVIDLSGTLSAELPELRFLVQSEKLKASVRTQVQDASVAGLGRLLVWPATKQARLLGQGEKSPLQIRGRGGEVLFRQDASEVEGWADLKEKLGPELAKRVVTDFHIDPQSIAFEVRRMEMGQFSENEGQAALEITHADLGPIRIQGDVWGKLFARLPGGLYFPISIPETAKMAGASVQIDRLQDRRAEGQREVTFQKLTIAGEESQATFSKKDQKRCGIDRQHLHASLGLFQFKPEDREIQIRDIDPHFHIYLKNPLGGGCLKIE